MKHAQVLIDEPLLWRLDADPQVRRLGRSEVLRRAVPDYLTRFLRPNKTRPVLVQSE